MQVGICRVSCRLPENMSLKGKRRVVKSILTRLQQRFHVSAAEVDNHEAWQIATLGIGFVSNDKRFTNEVLSKAVDFIENGRFDIELLGYEIEILPV